MAHDVGVSQASAVAVRDDRPATAICGKLYFRAKLVLQHASSHRPNAPKKRARAYTQRQQLKLERDKQLQ